MIPVMYADRPGFVAHEPRFTNFKNDIDIQLAWLRIAFWGYAGMFVVAGRFQNQD